MCSKHFDFQVAKRWAIAAFVVGTIITCIVTVVVAIGYLGYFVPKLTERIEG